MCSFTVSAHVWNIALLSCSCEMNLDASELIDWCGFPTPNLFVIACLAFTHMDVVHFHCSEPVISLSSVAYCYTATSDMSNLLVKCMCACTVCASGCEDCIVVTMFLAHPFPHLYVLSLDFDSNLASAQHTNRLRIMLLLVIL